jgi:TolB-like protein
MGVGLSALLLFTGCARSTLNTSLRPETVLVPPKATLAVVPFENLSNHRTAGLAATDLAASILYSQDYFRVVDASQVQDDKDVRFRRMETSAWERQLGVNVAGAAAVGRALNTDCVLAGALGEYGFVDGFGETATVGVTLRLVRSSNSEVLWAGSLSRRAASAAFSEESAHRLLHEVLRDLLGRMIRDLRWQQETNTKADHK